jgi:glycosyltransferase involved in cell wall biosynthesis
MNPGPSHFEEYLKEKKIEVHRIRFRGKVDWVHSFLSLSKILKKIKPHVVHTHFFDASVVGMLAAKFVSVPKRISTRHHSNLHHVYFKKGIVLDLMINRLATHVVAISGMVKQILEKWEKLTPEKVALILHGINMSDFDTVEEERIKNFRQRYSIGDHDYVVGVISRLTEWKGIQYIIPAFKSFLNHNPSALLLILNAHGDYEKEIKAQLEAIPPDRYRLIRFERDIPAAYKSFNIFVHVPVDAYSEAFGLVYIESLASKVPSIFTLSGVAPDFIKHRENAIVVPFHDADAIQQAMIELYTDEELGKRIAEHGYKSVASKFPMTVTVKNFEQLYKQ